MLKKAQLSVAFSVARLKRSSRLSCSLGMVITLLSSPIACSRSTDFQGNVPKKAADLKAANLRKIRQDFPATDIKKGELTLNPENNIATQDIVLRSDLKDETKRIPQLLRPLVTKFYKQGNPGVSRSEVFNQSELGILDLQIIIDSSASMAEEQANLSTKLQPLLQYIQNRDWRINVTTTDTAAGCSRGLIRKGDANATNTFANLINAGTRGSGYEKGILQAVNGLSCASLNWVRPNSTVAVLIVSDEDNCSNGLDADCINKPYNTETYLTNYLANTLGRKLGEMARVYGIYWVPGTDQAGCTTALNVANQYHRAVLTSNGKYGSICDADYTNTLTSISQDLALVLNPEFTLSETPDAGTLKLKVNSQPVTGGYTLTGRSVRFNPAPPKDSVIEASYTVGFSPLPVTSRFALGEAPASGTLNVVVNGKAAAAAEYGVDAATNEIVFAASPAYGADIKIEFKKNVTLLTTFLLNPAIQPASLNVKVNGVGTTEYTLSAAGELVFNAAPQEASLIDAAYKVVLGPVYKYPVAVSDKSIKTVKFTDASNGQSVAVELSGNVATIKPEDFVNGRKITMSYRLTGAGVLDATLPQTPLPNTLVLSASPEECSKVLNGTKLTIDCNVQSGTDVKVSWDYLGEVKKEFTATGVPYPEFGSWQVFINNVETTAYKRDGVKVTLRDLPNADAIITLAYVPAE